MQISNDPFYKMIKCKAANIMGSSSSKLKLIMTNCVIELLNSADF